MSIPCTRCEQTGFLNAFALPADVLADGHEAVLRWINDLCQQTDVTVCDCCGDGESWYGTPGEHYNSMDPLGKNGPYAYNGGLCECH